MANSYELSVEIDAAPEEVWAVIGNPVDLGWFDPVEAAHVEADVRYVKMGDGRNLVERLLERDEERRYYSYTVIEGSRTTMLSHEASFEVQELDDGRSRVIWRTDATPEDDSVDLESRIAPAQQKGLENLALLFAAAENAG